MTDQDGYPTDEELGKVRTWIPTTDWRECFTFIRSVWRNADWGWSEWEHEGGICYRISTGGWSGNESIVSAMEANLPLWAMCWISSRTGGHYEFRSRSDGEFAPPEPPGEAQVEPGQLIAQVECPCCGAELRVEHGDEVGEIGVIGSAPEPPGEEGR